MDICWSHGVFKKVYRWALCADQTKQKAGITNTCHKWVWSDLIVNLRVKNLNQAYTHSPTCLFYTDAPLFHEAAAAAAASFQHLPSERAVGVSAILLAVRCHPFQRCSFRMERHFITSPTKQRKKTIGYV